MKYSTEPELSFFLFLVCDNFQHMNEGGSGGSGVGVGGMEVLLLYYLKSDCQRVRP